MKDDIKSFLLRIPAQLYKKLRNEGDRTGRSVNSLCSFLLTSALENPIESKNQSHGLATHLTGDLAHKLHSYIQEEIIPAFSHSLVGVILFGSAARNELRASSDIDLLIVLKIDSPLDRDSYDKLRLRQINNNPISPLLVHLPVGEQTTRSVWLEVALEGCILYDTDFSLSHILINIRHEIVSGSIRRETAYGVPYWIHQDSHARENAQ